MSEWSEGYVSDINYTYGYYSELNPNNTVIPFLMAGLTPPKIKNACELGFGQGVSLNIHASASDVQWYGTDFNPSQVGFAQELAEIAGNNAQVYDQSFRAFCERDDLPEFDFIGLHGIWAWISLENQQIITDFIRRKLRVGGVVYISYNTLPGWSTLAPLQHILNQYDQVVGSRKDSKLERVNNAFDFSKTLMQLSPAMVQQAPVLLDRIQHNSEKDPSYLAHEYLNQDWQALYFSQVAEALAPAKLSYVSSANYLEDFSASNLNAEQQAFLNNVADPVFKQTSKDYLQNKIFRRDYWVKGARSLSAHQLEQHWQPLRFILLDNAANVELKISGALGTVDLREDIYQPLLTALSDHKIHSYGSLKEQMPASFNAQLLSEALAILHGKGSIALVQETATMQAARPKCKNLNAHIIEQNINGSEVSYLASPVTGGSVQVGRVPMLFLHAYMQGQTEQQAWVESAWQVLSSQGQCLLKEGNKLVGDEANLAELTSLAQTFEQDLLQSLKYLQIVE
ncbi:class I SAM-dependent methyltransferase [Psychrobacter arenosus]|uniref:class I SAM-dependent methyltransferase n=1 Tax=Psychrobacter arenosus TaxID=256326 RepID=UPI00191882F1|nr:class I SAM-dependent methyltransferase [Psychrobacter arenosus]